MASRQLLRLFRPRASRLLPPRTLPTQSFPPRLASPAVRLAHSIPRPRPTQDSPSDQGAAAAPQDNGPAAESPKKPSGIQLRPHYQIQFTCRPCGAQSKHIVSKQSYHFGSTLITCPGCKNKHVISDHLKIFGDRKITVEDLLREKGELVRKGTLGDDGSIEFWPENEQGSPKS